MNIECALIAILYETVSLGLIIKNVGLDKG